MTMGWEEEVEETRRPNFKEEQSFIFFLLLSFLLMHCAEAEAVEAVQPWPSA
jgi:hypothetical protein